MLCSDKICDTESRSRHRMFWENSSNGVPLVFAVSDNPGFTKVPWKNSLSRKEWDLMPDWHLNRIDNFLEGTCFFGDAMPLASLMVGLDITNTAVLAGGDYDYSSTGDFIDFKCGDFDLAQPIPDFTPDHPLAVALKHCYETVIPQVRDRAFVNTPMTLDALSSLYGLRGSRTFLLDLVQKKDRVRQRVREMTDASLAFYDYFYNLLVENGYGQSGSWFQVFCEGKFESVRCDFSVMLSREMFCEFVVPELTQVCDHMDHTLFNMCSVRHARFIDDLTAIPSLDGIFWNPEPYLEGIRDYLPELETIKDKGMLLEIVCHRVDDAVLAARTLGPEGLYLMFEPRFSSPDQARHAVDRVYNACR
jgi:hypothetical protein